MANVKESFSVPFNTPITVRGVLTHIWITFFREIYERLFSLGKEGFQAITNGGSNVEITGLKFNYRYVMHVMVIFCIQRQTSSVNTTESGIFMLTYDPEGATWDLTEVSVDNPDDTGVTFNVTSTGQVRYTASSIGGTAVLSRVFYRAFTMKGKAQGYSFAREA